MRQDRFTLDNLMEYIYNQQIAQIPAKMYNDDAQVKYLEFGSLYTYCCHGNKEHQIRRWLRERIAYVDSMLGYFTSQDDQVTIRMNKSGAVSFSVTTYIPLYFSVKWSNAQGGVQTIKMKRGETKEFSYNSTTSTDQEVIIYHAQYIKDLNNLSNLNPSSCILANALKLTNVEIHSPLLYNINVTNNKYLRNINLRNCSALGTVTATGSSLDLSKCKYLQHCDIYNTNLTEVQLGSDGGSLLDIYYPKTVQTIQLIKQRLLHTIGLPYGNNGDEIPTALYTVTIQECPSITKLNTSTNAAINSSFISMSYCNNLTIRNALDLEELNFDGFHRLKNVIIENMYNLTSVGFNDLLPKGETSTIQYIGMSNCPKLETLELNCTSNDYEITFADKAVLNLGGLFGLKSITSNCVLKGIETIVIPTKLESMFFTNDYGEGYSSIKNIWVSSVCDVNTSGTTAKVTYIGDSNYSGIDFNGMNLKNIDLGALVNIPNAINFNIAPTTVNPHFNLNRDGETYPYLQPEGSIDLSNYTESLARFFDGVDLDKMQIICKGSLPQTDLSYCFYNATFSKLQSITTLLNKVANIVNLDYCFYRTTINSTSVINSIKMGANSTMNYTFAECSNITTLNNVTIPKNVTAVEGMFYKCPLTSINSMIVNVQGSIKGLFKGCENLTSITTLLIPNVTDVESTFEGCINLETLTGFNLPATCTNVSNLFKGCYKLTRLNGLNLGSTITKGDTWCPPNLTTVENCTINTDKAKFTNVTSLVTIQDTNITGDDLSDLFNGCTNLNTIKNCNITANKSLARAFKSCSLITQPPITVIKDSVTNIDEMYSGCTGITNISGMTFGNGITSATNWIPNTTITNADNITIKNNYIKFEGFTNLVSSNNLTFLGTDLSSMFKNCSNLSSCTITAPNKITRIGSLFFGCNITEFDMKDINTSECTYWIEMFRGCPITLLKNVHIYKSGIYGYWIYNNGQCTIDGLYIHSQDACSVGKNDINHPFMTADGIGHIKNINFDESITDISNLFKGCRYLLEDFVIPSHITKCTETFKGCTSMTHIHSNWNNSYTRTITPTDCYNGCTAITYIDDVNVITYEGKEGLDEIPEAWGGYEFSQDDTCVMLVEIPNDNTEIYISLSSMPSNTGLISWGDGTSTIPPSVNIYHTYNKGGKYALKFKTTRGIFVGGTTNRNWIGKYVTKILQLRNNYSFMVNGFRGMSNLEYANISNSIITGNYLFMEDSKLTTVDAYNCDFRGGYFGWEKSMTTLNGYQTWTFSTGNASNAFRGLTKVTSLDLTGWDTSNVTTMTSMFDTCSNLTEIKGINSLNTSKVILMNNIFYGCKSLTSLDLSNWDVHNVTNLQFAFYGCLSLTNNPIKNWELDNVVNLSSMFSNCKAMTTPPITVFGNASNPSKSINYSGLYTNWETVSYNNVQWEIVGACDVSRVFGANKKMTSINITWKTDEIVNVQGMFVDGAMLQSMKTYNLTSCGQTIFTGYFFGGVGSQVNSLFTEFECIGTLSYSKDISLYPNLTKQSLLNIINCLATTSTTLTLTLGATNLAKLSATEIKIATDRGWTVI